MTAGYFSFVSPTYIENWGAALAAMSVAQSDIPLTLEEASALADGNERFARFEGRGAALEGASRGLAERVEAALKEYPEGAFVRLGSRSGKDSAYAMLHGLRVTGGEDAVRMLTHGSRRVAFDLRLALRCGYRPHLFVRQWVEFPPWAEFRCFMRGRRLVGISQYDCKNLGHCPKIAANAERTRRAVEAFFEQFRAGSHLDDVVFDVFVRFDREMSPGVPDVILLELNPFFEKTEAALFSWRDGGDFDGSFRYL